MYGISESSRAFASEAQAAPVPFVAFIVRTTALFSSSLVATVFVAAVLHRG